MKKLLTIASLLLLFQTTAHAGVITTYGSITALNHISEMDIVGTADFNNDGIIGAIALDAYTSQGLTFHTDELSSILPGVSTSGRATNGPYAREANYFPDPIAAGGSTDGLVNYFAGVATFNTSVTSFGLTASRNGNQYLTVWDRVGNMLGQLNWQPAQDSSFIGFNTGGIEIGMIAYGNDDLWNGAAYGLPGPTNISDNWVWGNSVADVPEPSGIFLFGLGLVALVLCRRKA